jgi:hypothetical protein
MSLKGELLRGISGRDNAKEENPGMNVVQVHHTHIRDGIDTQ